MRCLDTRYLFRQKAQECSLACAHRPCVILSPPVHGIQCFLKHNCGLGNIENTLHCHNLLQMKFIRSYIYNSLCSKIFTKSGKNATINFISRTCADRTTASKALPRCFRSHALVLLTCLLTCIVVLYQPRVAPCILD